MKYLFLILFISCIKKEKVLKDVVFPDGPNKEMVSETCTACHSGRLVLQNKMSRERWDETLTWMQQKHNLPEFDLDDRNKILDYLEYALSPKSIKSMDGLPPRRVNPLKTN